MNLFAEMRQKYQPLLPKVLVKSSHVVLEKQKIDQHRSTSLKTLFPKIWEQKGSLLVSGQGKTKALRIGVLFSGGQASGGHNVIAGLWDAMLEGNSHSQLIGFLDGPSGLISNKARVLHPQEIDAFRNLGGFHLIGSGRTKIETEEQRDSCIKTCKALALDGIVIVGGDDSNTNAAILAEYFLSQGCDTKVIGVPKTIDGDLRSKEIEISFGFDSACKTYSELIGNIALDALSSKKYYHMIKLMGRSASHITLECALATHPNLALIGEEKESLSAIVNKIANLVCSRSEKGKEYGVILIPEGLIEFIPEMGTCIAELNQLLGSGRTVEHLSKQSGALFASLPERIQKQLLLDRDPHGNIALSQVETESLLIELVSKELSQRSSYQGKFSPISHFFGYEGRACFPSNFDANYCYALGVMAAIGVREGATGVICAIQKMKGPVSDWEPSLVPITQLMHLEERSGKQKPVIEKVLVDLKSKPFLQFAEKRDKWALEDSYQSPGPIQFFGDSVLVDSAPRILI